MNKEKGVGYEFSKIVESQIISIFDFILLAVGSNGGCWGMMLSNLYF